MELKEYQMPIAATIDKRFREEGKRFVGVKLPTGAGKSYLFMDQLIKFMDEYDAEEGNTPSEDIVSSVPIKYYTPTTGIVAQTQINIIKSIFIDKYIEKYYHGDIHDAVIKIGERMMSPIKKISKTNNRKILEALDEIYNRYSNSGEKPEIIITNIMNEFIPLLEGGYESIIKKECPNLDIVCYKEIEDIDIDSVSQDTRLVAFDEAHRTGSNIWGPKAEEMVQKLKNTKFLSITATPERDVDDGFDPIEYFAALSGDYSPREMSEKSYLASDMTLVDALQQGLVVKPEIVIFDCMLDETKEYQYVKDLLNKTSKKNLTLRFKDGRPIDNYNAILLNFIDMNKITGKLEFLKKTLENMPERKEELEILNSYLNCQNGKYEFDDFKKFGRLLDLINETDDKKTDLGKKYDNWKNEQIQKIVDKEKSARPYLSRGKHITFTPRTTTASSSKEIMFRYKERVTEYFKANEDDVLITHGNRNVLPARIDKANLDKFILAPETLDSPMIMVAMDKFNEGIHVDGVVGLEMFRSFDDSKTTEKDEPQIIFLQQIGRCIHSIKDRRSYR